MKLNHFLSFVDQPYFYQDIALIKLKLDSGEQILIPNVIRTVGRSTMIEQYLKHCSEEDFKPLGKSTLFRILQVREASQRKFLQGLDNIAASEAKGFESMHKIVDDLRDGRASAEWCKEVQSALKNGKRYLKTVVKTRALVPITAGALLLATLKTPNLRDLVYISIKSVATGAKT